MSALDDLDRAITHERDLLGKCRSDHGCQHDHHALIDTYLDARTTLTQPNPDLEDKRRALAILYTARTATGGTP